MLCSVDQAVAKWEGEEIEREFHSPGFLTRPWGVWGLAKGNKEAGEGFSALELEKMEVESLLGKDTRTRWWGVCVDKETFI